MWLTLFLVGSAVFGLWSPFSAAEPTSDSDGYVNYIEIDSSHLNHKEDTNGGPDTNVLDTLQKDEECRMCKVLRTKHDLDAVSLCAWLRPYRLRDHFYPVAVHVVDEKNVLAITLSHGRLGVTVRSCIQEYSEKLELRIWNHVCLVSYGNMSLYLNGNMLTPLHSRICNASESPSFKSKFLLLNAGKYASYQEAYIGEVADIRVFFRSLNKTEIDSIHNISKTPSDFHTFLCAADSSCEAIDRSYGLPQGFDTFPIPSQLCSKPPLDQAADVPFPNVSMPRLRSVWEELNFAEASNIPGVEYGKISEKDLSVLVIPHHFLKGTNSLNYSMAQKVCSRYGGSLPVGITNLGKNTNVEAIIRFSDRYSLNLRDMWLEDIERRSLSNMTTCPLGRLYTVSSTFEIRDVDCAIKSSYICQISTSKQLKFLGLPPGIADDYDKVFHLVEEKALELQSQYHLTIEYENYQIIFEKQFSSNKIYQLSIMDLEDLIGRKLWKPSSPDSSSDSVELTLSSCTEEQFTCSNGDCVELEKVCNFYLDCLDETDETFCDHILPVGSSYNKATSGAINGDILKVGLHVMLDQIHGVSLGQNVMKVALRVTAEWCDYRVRYKFLHDDEATRFGMREIDMLWQPFIVMSGTVHDDEELFAFPIHSGTMTAEALDPGQRTSIGSIEAIVFDGPSVLLKHTNKDTVSIQCEMDLFFFPFDTQVCKLDLYMQGTLHNDVSWDINNIKYNVSDKLSIALYDLDRFKMIVWPNDTRKLSMEIAVARKFGSYILNTFLPCLVLGVIGLLTHLLTVANTSDRINVTLSCLIVMATLFSQLSSTLPESAASKLIDVWMFGHVVMLAVVFCVHVFVAILYQKEETWGRKEEALKKVEDDTMQFVWAVKSLPRLAGSGCKDAPTTHRCPSNSAAHRTPCVRSSSLNTVAFLSFTTIYFVLVTLYVSMCVEALWNNSSKFRGSGLLVHTPYNQLQ